MNRINIEQNYWNEAATDPEVDEKYICDLPTDECLDAIGELHGDVLEIGCGVGRLMQPGYHGIDISEGMLAIARERKPECGFLLCDGRTIPYSDESFDSVYCMLVFQHLPPEAIGAYIMEVHRVLRKNGVFVFQFIEGDEAEPFSHHYSLRVMETMLKRWGFEVNEIKKGLVHQHWTWVYAKKADSEDPTKSSSSRKEKK